jgi:putative glutamine amidotransferase
MTPPLIGITTRNGKSGPNEAVLLLRTYVEAIVAAGGAPLLIPAGIPSQGWRLLCDRLDGILLSGGGDIDPAHYGGDGRTDLALEIDPARDEIELGLARSAAAGGKPFLGICRGAQLVNVALGGSLYLDIAADLPQAGKHDFSSQTERSLLAHQVQIDPGARLAGIVGETKLQVNSLHHQAAREVAPTLKAVAHAPDGVVEGLELPGHPFGLAVQWHPECIPDQPASRRLFQAFVEACQRKS